MSLDKELSGIVRFNSDEFHIWKWQMRSLLQYKQILTIVNGTETLAEAADKENWQAREYFAFTLLCNSVERHILTPLLHCTTSTEIWNTLLSIYEHKSSENVHELQQRFFSAKLQPQQSISEYIGQLQLILSELAEIGDTTFNNDTLISKLTTNLLEGFDSFITAWDSTPLDERTFANLQLGLLKEETKLKRRLVEEASPDTKAYYSNKSSAAYMSSRDSGSHVRRENPVQRGSFIHRGSHSRSYHPTSAPHTSYGDRQTPRHSSHSLRTMELAALKARTRCNCCGRIGHWWQECPDRHRGPPHRSTRASFAEAIFAHHSSSEEFDVNTESYEPPSHELLPYDYDLSYDSSYYPDVISRAYMVSDPSLSSSDIQNLWIADSGANKHMSHNLQWFSSYQPLPAHTSWPINAVAGHQCYVAGIGTIKVLVQLPHNIEVVLLENVLYVPGLQCNLFSTTLMAMKHSIHFVGSATHCHFIKNNEIRMTGRLIQDMRLHSSFTSCYWSLYSIIW